MPTVNISLGGNNNKTSLVLNSPESSINSGSQDSDSAPAPAPAPAPTCAMTWRIV